MISDRRLCAYDEGRLQPWNGLRSLIFSDLEQAVLDLKQKLDNERTIRTESDANRMTMDQLF
jgi:hypothetical protein